MSTKDTALPIYPDDLLDDPPNGVERNWWAFYTKSRQEKALARDLLAHDIAYFLPLIDQKKKYARRIITRSVPLFAGYLFLYISEEERVTSLTTNRVSKMIAVHEPERLQIDLRHLLQLIKTGAALTPESRLVPGNRVKIRTGVFAGIEGTVIRRQGTTRVLVGINFLQQGASVAVDDFCLEPI